MVGRDRHGSPADRARAMAAVEIAGLVGRDLVRVLVRRRRASSGKGRPVATGRRRQEPVRVTPSVFRSCLRGGSRRRGLTVCDAAYLELARREGAPLTTLDAALATAASAELVPLLREPRQI